MPSHHFSSTVPVEWASADQPMPVIHRASRQFESKGLFDPQVLLESGKDFKSPSKDTNTHPPAKLEEIRKGDKRYWFQKIHMEGGKKHTQAERALFVFVFFVRAIMKVLQS